MGSEVFKVKAEKDKVEISIPKKPKWHEWLGAIILTAAKAIAGTGILSIAAFVLFVLISSFKPDLIIPSILMLAFSYLSFKMLKGIPEDWRSFFSNGKETISISREGLVKIGRYVTHSDLNLKLIEKSFDNKQIKNFVAQSVLGKGKLRLDYDDESLSFAKHISYPDAIKIIEKIKETGFLDSLVTEPIEPQAKAQHVKDQTANIKKAYLRSIQKRTLQEVLWPQSFRFPNPLKTIKKYYHKASDLFSDYFMSFNKWQFIKDKTLQGFRSFKKSIGISGVGTLFIFVLIGITYMLNAYVTNNYPAAANKFLELFEFIGAIGILIFGVMCSITLIWAYFKVFYSSQVSNLLKDLEIKTNNPTEFIEGILNMVIHVMKLDGTTQDEEKEYIRMSFNKMLGKGSGEKALEIIKKKENGKIDLVKICEGLNKTMTKRNKQLLVLYLVFIAGKSDNKIQKNELEGLRDIVDLLELKDEDWNLIRSWVFKNKSSQMDILNNLKLSPEEVEDQFNRLYFKYKMDIGLSKSQYIKRSVQEHLLKINQAYHHIKEGQLDVTEELSEKLKWLGLDRGVEQMHEMENKLLNVLKLMIKKSMHNPRLVDKYEQSLQEAYVYLLKNLRNVVIESNKKTEDRVDQLLEENEEGINRVDKLLLDLKGMNDLNDKTENEMKMALDELELWKEKIKLYDTQ